MTNSIHNFEQPLQYTPKHEFYRLVGLSKEDLLTGIRVVEKNDDNEWEGKDLFGNLVIFRENIKILPMEEKVAMLMTIPQKETF